MSSCSTRSLTYRHEPVLCSAALQSMWKTRLFWCCATRVRTNKETADNGVWLATTQEHHQSLRLEFPNMRSIQVLGKKVTGWQVLPADAPDFEAAAMRACELIIGRDPRIGKVPGARASASRVKKTGKSSKGAKTKRKKKIKR